MLQQESNSTVARHIAAMRKPGESPFFQGVDEDVDIHNPAEVEWAVATRFQADKDLVIVPESQGSKLDPSARNGVGAKMGMDPTKPLNADEMKFKRIRVPGEAEIDLNKVVGPVPSQLWRKALGR